MTPEQIRATRGEETQAEFARRVGCTIPTLSRWENGHRAPAAYYEKRLRQIALYRQRRPEEEDSRA